MFAGLPGIGVGTLFYVLAGLCMPALELVRVARGTSSVARWRIILRQCFFSVSVVASIMLAERGLMWILGETEHQSMNPARILNQHLSTRAPESIIAAPIAAALLLLVGVLLTVEVLRIVTRVRHARRPREDDAMNVAPFEPDDAVATD